MTWQDFAVARQLLTEEYIGAPRRAAAHAEMAREDAQFAATGAALRKVPKVA